jgi:VIT1/CCC1 family predicted Fe2+/Mn2+ transporter
MAGGGLAVSTAVTAAVFFAIGSAKSRWSLAPWWRSGAETLVIGLSAAGLAYLVGHLLSGLVGETGI